MRCSSCGSENCEGRKFCAECGAELTLACGACGAKNRPGERFCGDCGKPLPEAAKPGPPPDPRSYTPKHLAEKILTSRSALEGERKHVVVLFADVAGFTSMSERSDPEVVYRGGCREDVQDFLEAVGPSRYAGTPNQRYRA